MIVKSITETTKKKVKIVFDNQFTLVLYKGELKLFHLRENAEVPDDLIETIENEVLKKRAVKYAMQLLVKKDYTCKELRDKLKKAGYSENCQDHAIDYVASYHYIDDAAYARRYLETYSNRKSVKIMMMELSRKGISEELIEQAKDEAEMEEETDTLHYYAEKKARGLDLSLEKDRQKLIRYLMGKGFGYREVSEEVTDICHHCLDITNNSV